MKKTSYLMLVALTVGMFTACDDDDEDTTQINSPEPKEQWGKTLRGNNQALLAFPDIYADYWEYTYSYKDNSDIGLRLVGKFLKSHFLNPAVYNGETQTDVSSIEDINIQPDGSPVNPYVKGTDGYGANDYTIYIIPVSTPASARAPMKNVCEFPEDVNTVSIFVCLHLAKQHSGDEYGGVDMPAIQAPDVTTGGEVDFPECEKCNVHESSRLPPMNFLIDMKQLPFMCAPLSLVYPSSPTEYLFARVKLNKGEVATFRFIPSAAPKSVSEYVTVDVRYQSTCPGSAESYSYASICDEEIPEVDKGGLVTFIMADANSVKLPDLQTKAEANDGTYILTWNRKEQGDGILTLYRNMVTNEGYPHSMHKLMGSVSLAVASDGMSDFNPMTMLARLAMGNWRPQGNRFVEDEYLSDSFSYDDVCKQDRPIG